MTLFQNSRYLVRRWWVIAYCLLVLVAMWGFFVAQAARAQGWAGLGLTFFAVFAFTEIFRQILVLFYLNGLRAGYLDAAYQEKGARLSAPVFPEADIVMGVNADTRLR